MSGQANATVWLLSGGICHSPRAGARREPNPTLRLRWMALGFGQRRARQYVRVVFVSVDILRRRATHPSVRPSVRRGGHPRSAPAGLMRTALSREHVTPVAPIQPNKTLLRYSSLSHQTTCSIHPKNSFGSSKYHRCECSNPINLFF